MATGIGKHVRAARESKGFTQSRLARSLGVSQQVVCNWERGLSEPNTERIRQIAKALDVSVALLLGETEERKREEVRGVVLQMVGEMTEDEKKEFLRSILDRLVA